MKLTYKKGLSDGIPIALGYFSVSFAFGISSVKLSLSAAHALLVSMTNLTSAGQLAGIGIMAGGGGILEMALAMLIINLRYFLMSATVSQKLAPDVKWYDRFFMPFFMTDEIFALASSKESVGARYMYGLGTLPWLGWSAGTLAGALFGSVLPESVLCALDVAIYGMFIAVIIPASKKSRPVAIAAALSAALSCVFSALGFTGGFSIIVCALASSALLALIRPVKDEEGAK